MELNAVAISEAIGRRSAAHGGEEAILGAVVYPLVAEHGAEAVLAELVTKKGDPLVASALAYAARLAGLRLTDMFSADEIVAAALDYLGTVGAPTKSSIAHGLRHGNWAWSALFLHHPGDSAADFDDEEHFRLVLELIERAPWDNDVLWMIGDGPLAHAAADEARFDELNELMKTNPKLALIWRLMEVDWPHGTP